MLRINHLILTLQDNSISTDSAALGVNPCCKQTKSETKEGKIQSSILFQLYSIVCVCVIQWKWLQDQFIIYSVHCLALIK